MEDSKNIIIQAKNARIIAILAEKFDGSLDKAMDVFYKSAGKGAHVRPSRAGGSRPAIIFSV